MKRRNFTGLAMLAVSASLAFAQSGTHTPPTPAQMVANQVARLTTLLTLTTAQQASATTIFTAEQTALSGLRTSMDTAHTALTTAVEANDAAGISAAATQTGSLTSQEVLARGTAEAAFYAILTPAQQTTYKALGGPGEGPGGGRGGPGGRGGFGPHP